MEGKDYTVIESKTDHLVTGKKYHGTPSGRPSTTGHLNKYIVVDGASKPSSSTTAGKPIQKRVKQFNEEAMVISGGTVEDRTFLYTELIRLEKELFENVLRDAGFNFLTNMKPVDGVQLQSLLRLSTYSFRNLRRALENIEMNILPSEGEMDKVRK